MRPLRFIEPWNSSNGVPEVEEKPLLKCVMAGAERVPPAPWVKIRGGWGWGEGWEGAY